jgi:short-subunit dehydrogenase
MPRSLAGSTVLVAAATGGLGAPIAARLAAAGARVVAFVRSADRAAATGVPFAAVVTGDLRSSADAARAVAAAVEVAGGRFHGVVNAGGVVAFGPAADLDDDTLETLFAVNVFGPVRLVRAAAPHLAEGGFVATISAVVAETPVGNMAAYSASKAALTAFDVAVQRELRRSKVSVIDCRPPHTETGLATRPLAGTAPALPTGLTPEAVADRIVAAIVADEREVPASAFGA